MQRQFLAPSTDLSPVRAARRAPTAQPLAAHVVQRRCACGGSCPACRSSDDPTAVLPVQPKLTVGAPDDAFEHEADAVADQVMRMAVAPPDEGERLVQRSPAGVPAAGSVDESVVALSGGQALPESFRAEFEPRFGHDLSGVRVHADAHADEAARSIDARAFTYGNHIAFRAGEYSPGDATGQRLLAHEITHTIQQGAVQPFLEDEG